MSYSPVRPRLSGAGRAFLSQIQTAADFQKLKNIYIRVNERQQRWSGLFGQETGIYKWETAFV
jgi:hypothetical protein